MIDAQMKEARRERDLAQRLGYALQEVMAEDYYTRTSIVDRASQYLPTEDRADFLSLFQQADSRTTILQRVTDEASRGWDDQ
jgi:hypothetical protein